MSSVIRSLYTETHSPQIKSLHHHLKTHGLEAVTAHIQLKLLKAYSSQLNQNLLYEFTIFPALFYDFFLSNVCDLSTVGYYVRMGVLLAGVNVSNLRKY